MTTPMTRGMLIEPDGTAAETEIQPESLSDLYRLLDCRLVDVVAIRPGHANQPGIDMWVDDEGFFVEQPERNWIASHMAQRVIVGSVFITGNDGKGAMQSLQTHEMVELLQGALLLTPSYTLGQVELARETGNWWTEGREVLHS